MCPNCAIDLPPRRALPAFTAEVISERARLAMLDPEGERDTLATLSRHFDWTAQAFEPACVEWLAGATAPLDDVRARQILLHLAEPEPLWLRVTDSGSSLNERDLLDRLGCDPGRDRGMIRCPAHEDRAASLSWRFANGKTMLHCFAGCTFEEIRAAL
jgi:hypothetical protein